MRNTLIRLTATATLAISFASGNVLAAPSSDADSSARVGGNPGGGGSTVYDFEDDDVDGEILSPDGANLSARANSKFASMITIRPHFIPELIKLSNDI